MSILGSIISKIFHAATQITTAMPQAQASPAVPSGGAQPSSQTASAGPQPGNAVSQQMPATAPLQHVDVHAVLTDLASKHGETLNWQQSIVDLMKLLNLDSSLDARKELAKELNYTGDTSDSATMNIWLHRQVMQKLAENGGTLPDSLKAA